MIKFKIAIKIFPFLMLLAACKANINYNGKCKTLDLIVDDYCRHNKKYLNKFDVFYIWNENVHDNKYSIYGIMPIINAFLLTLQNNMANIPTHYMIYEDRTFLWREHEDEVPSPDIMRYLNSLSIIDSIYLKYELGLIAYDEVKPPIITTGSDIKSTKYIFCINNPCKIVKRIKTSYPIEDKVLMKIKCR